MSEVAEIVKQRIDVKSIKYYVGVENLIKDKAGAAPTTIFSESANVIGFAKDDILVGNIRPYLKKIWMSDINGGTNGDVVTIRLKSSSLIPKFLYYILASDDFFHYHNQYAKGAKMPRGDKKMIMKYTIPVPPIDEQERIVSILDRFEKLTNDLTQGLPAEIELRRQQYEYYRNKLLSFPKIKLTA